MATISAHESPQLQQIDLTKLNIQQLTQIKQQLDQVILKINCLVMLHIKTWFFYLGNCCISRLLDNSKNGSIQIFRFG